VAQDSPASALRATGSAGGPAVPDHERRRRQWEALRALRKISRLRRVTACRRRPAGEHVIVGRRRMRAHYSGLQTCGSVWSCPVCSARIQAERADELLLAVDRAHSLGLKVALLTLTMRHRKGDRLKHLWDGLAHAWQPAIATDRAVRKARNSVGMVGWVRRVEATYGVNGWHLHVHALLFYRDGSQLDALRDAIWTGWLRRLRMHGFDAVQEHGIVLRELDLGQAREQISGYLNKATYEEKSGSAARELAGQIGKARRNGNRTPFDVLADLVRLGLSSDRAIWWDWERASKGRRALTWSKGLRERLLAQGERCDEEIAADNDGDQVDVAAIDWVTWEEIMVRRLEVKLLEAIEQVPVQDSFAAALKFMDAHGLDPPLRPPPRE
jgi:Replication protein